ncbi:MAG: CPBP family intramembrane metalloprotease [Thermoanaerobaculia bacterium]|nr:CPBP family intramembrane metalloprotease [Thermoanaerobaculia bacterium]MBP9826173.1 CPBP family intramembrane metalloprotease [Thermoanaerobaculia bacterium]
MEPSSPAVFADSAAPGRASAPGREEALSRLRLRPLLAWVIIPLGGLVLAALAAPFIYSALLELLPKADVPFSRVYNRAAMLIAALLLLLLRDPLGWRGLPGLLVARSGSGAVCQIVAGFLAALLGVGIAVGAALVMGWLALAGSSYEFVAGRTATALVGGLVVAFLEESFFRGLMFVSLAASLGTLRAAIASSGAYALVHLLVSDPALGRQGYSVGAGLAYLGNAVARQIEPASLLPLCGLFLCGLVLALSVRRSGALFLAIGLHAGWVFSFQVLRHATRPLGAIPGHSYLATHHYLVGTTWAWVGIFLGGIFVLSWWFWAERRPVAELLGAGLPRIARKGV